MILPYADHEPKLAPDTYIAPGATVIGRATIGAQSSLWFGAIVREDERSHLRTSAANYVALARSYAGQS